MLPSTRNKKIPYNASWNPFLKLFLAVLPWLRSHQSVKDYLRCVTREQLLARVTPKQATPFFVHKLTQLPLHLKRKLDNPCISSLQKFVIARDQAYFKMALFSGDRPGDLSHIKVPEILRFPNDKGFLFNHIWGKTLRDGDQNVFGIRRNPHTVICPIRGIEQYMDVAQQLSIDFSRGYLFRPTTPKGGIQDSPFTLPAAETCLKVYLKEMNMDERETLQGFRASCAITLALTGADLVEIMDHVGWSRHHTALYYLQLAKVFNPAGARLLSSSAVNVTEPWTNINELKRFVCAFPTGVTRKRQHSELA